MAKVGFKKGWSGSPFQLGYEANEGIDAGSAAKPADSGPRIGPGVEGRRVTMEVDRDGGRGARKGRRSSADD